MFEIWQVNFKTKVLIHKLDSGVLITCYSRESL